jgi:hypothetical protein
MMKKILTLSLLLSLFAISIPGATFAGERSITETDAVDSATLYVVHGIPGDDLGLVPGLPVDVLVNGELCALEGFTFGQTAGPLALDPGKYNIQISLSSEKPCGSTAPILEAKVTLDAGENATIVAYLDQEGKPTVGKFVNFDKATITTNDQISPRANSLLAVRHAANAPAVDVTATMAKNNRFRVQINDLSNSEEARARVPDGNWRVSLQAAQSPNPGADLPGSNMIDFRFGPETLTLKANQAYFVYAVGSIETGSFQLIIQTLTLPA